jgi:ribonucleotide monophosphatase NagD (HAD superfamily)
VYVIGGQGLFDALAERGLVVVQDIDDEPHAVVSGYHPDLRWKTVSDGAILVRRGLPWVASNMDVSVPTEHGPGPGNGVLVGAVARFAGVEPVVAGKPRRPLFDETVRRVGGDRPLVVGDRLDTDIEAAHSSGLDSLLVLTGVTGLDELVAAGERQRPTYLSSDLSGLGAAHPLPERTPDGWELDGWRAVVEDGELLVSGSGAVDDWWRVAVVAAWDHLDTTGDVVGTAKASAPGSVAADERDPVER